MRRTADYTMGLVSEPLAFVTTIHWGDLRWLELIFGKLVDLHVGCGEWNFHTIQMSSANS